MKENEIRPKEVFNEYLRLSQIDGAALDRSQFVRISCPGCRSEKSVKEFSKFDYNYDRCPDCGTLFCNPRPNDTQLRALYQSSKSSKFWTEVFFPTVQDARREKLIKPKAKRVAEHLITNKINVATICDVGAGHGLFLEELQNHLPNSSMYAIEPDANSCNVLERKKFKTMATLAEHATSWHSKFDFVMCFEVIEHVQQVEPFLKSIFNLLKPGGTCLITGLGCDGYDICRLTDQSKSIFPPHHLNFLSVKGFESAFHLSGFLKVEVQTPGELDLDIVLNSECPDRFSLLIKSRGPQAVSEFQEFLRRHKLSSHTWIWATR